MGQIPISLNDTQYRSNPDPTSLPQNFGMNRFAAVQERAAAIGKIGGQVADIATQYAAKNKTADLRADSLAAQAETAAITADADERAKSTTDPKAVRQIWEDAHSRYMEYVTGASKKEGREGVPNIRWSEQRKEFIGNSGAVMTQFRTKGESRIADVGRQASNATFLQTIHDGERAGDYHLIEQGITGLTENGTLTAEAAMLKRNESFARTDTLAVKTNLAAIENMDLAKAKEARYALVEGLRSKEDDDTFAAFKHLDPADREEYVTRADHAVENVQKRVEGAESDRLFRDFASGAIPLTIPGEKILKDYPGLSARDQVKILSDSAKAKAKPAMTPDLMRGAMDLIDATPVDQINGMVLARQLDAAGFKRETDKALFDALDDKFNPKPGSIAEKYGARLAGDKKRLFAAIDVAGQVGCPDPYGERKDPASELAIFAAQESDALTNFLTDRMKNGATYDGARAEYFELPRVKDLFAKKNVKDFINRALTAAAPRGTLADRRAAGKSILHPSARTNSTPSQAQVYKITEADGLPIDALTHFDPTTDN